MRQVAAAEECVPANDGLRDMVNNNEAQQQRQRSATKSAKAAINVTCVLLSAQTLAMPVTGDTAVRIEWHYSVSNHNNYRVRVKYCGRQLGKRGINSDKKVKLFRFCTEFKCEMEILLFAQFLKI